MKVVFVAPRFHTNQADLVEGLVGCGHSVKFFAYESRHSEDHRVVAPVVMGFAKISRKLRDDKRKLKYGLPSLSGVRSILASRPDVAVIRSFSFASLLLSILLRARGGRVVLYCQYPVYGDRFSLLKRLYYRAFAREVITPVRGRGDEDRNRTMLGQRWTYLPFVRNVSPLVRGREYCPGGVVRILVVGKFVARKMLPECLRALESLYGGRFTVKVVGTILDAKVFEETKSIVDRNGYMSIAVDLPHEAMDQEYIRSDLFILPSVDEPASYSQLEAMSCGCAVVCSDSNGTAEYIADGENGRIFDASNFERNLIDCLTSTLADPESIERMGKAGAENVFRNHGVARYDEYLHSLSRRTGTFRRGS